MITIDPVTMIVLILLTVVITAILVDALHRRIRLEGRREGEEIGQLRERALWWERTARASERVAVTGEDKPAESAGNEWELP